MNNTYENITLPKSITLPDTQTLSVISADQSKDDTSKCSEMCMKLLNTLSSKKRNPDDGVLRADESNYTYDDFDDYSCRYFSDNSFLIWNTHSIEEKIFDANKEKILYTNDTNFYETKYNIDGTQYSVKEATDFANDFIDKNIMQFFNKDEGLVLDCVIVVANKDGTTYDYLLRYAHTIDGIPVSTAGGFIMEEYSMRPSYLEVAIDSPNHIAQIENYAYYNVVKAEKLEDKFITLEASLENVEEYIAQYNIQEITEISMEYCSVYYQNEEHTFEYRPMWRFTVGEVSRDMVLYARKSVYVDMVTGEIITFNDMDGNITSSTRDLVIDPEELEKIYGE